MKEENRTGCLKLYSGDSCALGIQILCIFVLIKSDNITIMHFFIFIDKYTTMLPHKISNSTMSVSL